MMRPVHHSDDGSGASFTATAAAPSPSPSASSFSPVRLEDREFEVLRRLIHAETGISLASSKRVLLESRLARRLRALEMDSFVSYCQYLRTRLDEELVPLINCVTTNKTEFFREAHHFEFLRTHVLPAVEARAARSGKRRIRIWSAGCSTGEEPYSLALTLLEWLDDHPDWDVRILASDIDTNVLDAAARGLYPADRLDDVPLLWRRRWFRELPERPGWMQADDALRGLITFRRINLNEDPWPIRTTFDVILCRNVIIYFNRATQTSLLGRFAQLLDADGHLIIGHSESLAWLCDTFTSVRGQPTVYRLTSAVRRDASAATATHASSAIKAIDVSPCADAASNAADAMTASTAHAARRASWPAASRVAAEAGSSKAQQEPNAGAQSLANTSASSLARPAVQRDVPASAPPHSAAAGGGMTSADARAAQRTRAGAADAKSAPREAPVRELRAGSMHASAAPDILHTIIGCGVAVALFDSEARVGGLLHLLADPSAARSAGTAARAGVIACVDSRVTEAYAARDGERALAAPLAAAVDAGGVRAQLRPKVFSGAAIGADGASTATRSAGAAARGDVVGSVDARVTESKGARDGEQALAALLAAVIDAGGVRARLRAKVFGGASIGVDGTDGAARAARGVTCAHAFLERERIPIIAERIGGDRQIELLFHVDSGRARVRELPAAAAVAATATPAASATSASAASAPSAASTRTTEEAATNRPTITDGKQSHSVQNDALLVVDGTATEA